MTYHYKYGGSTAKRTLRCPGWAALANQLVEERGLIDNSSVHADRGSMLHNCCEILELEHLEYEDLLKRGVSYNGFELTEELLDTKVVPAMEALDELVIDYDVHTITTEETIKFSDIIGGTIDVFAEAEDTLVFVDYKFGEGIMVDAMDNDQLLFGGWTKISAGGFKKPLSWYKKVVLAIIQPADRRDEPLDKWEVGVQDLKDFGERFLAAVEIAEDSAPGENLCPGSHCQFCPASGLNDCPAKVNEANFNLEQLQKLDSGYPTGTGLTILDKKKEDFQAMDLAQALDIVEKLEPWIKDVRSFACKQLELGAEVDGWKLVPKRAMKRWVNTDHITKYLKRKLGAANAMAAKVISPAQAIKTAKALGVKLRLIDHIDAKSSGTTLVRESDPREAVLSVTKIAEGLSLLDDGVIYEDTSTLLDGEVIKIKK